MDSMPIVIFLPTVFFGEQSPIESANLRAGRGPVDITRKQTS